MLIFRNKLVQTCKLTAFHPGSVGIATLRFMAPCDKMSSMHIFDKCASFFLLFG